MVITGSNISMASNRVFSKTGTNSSIPNTIEETSENKSFISSSFGNDFLGIYDRYANIKDIASSGVTGASNPSTQAGFQQNVLQALLEKLMNAHVFGTNWGQSVQNPMSLRAVSYSEYESASFQTTGKVTTADGREIDFHMELEMTRSYMEYTDIQLEPLRGALRDPLVLNYDGGMPQVADQKFLFDLDGDGTKEEISTLQNGTGFLALDKNEDGIINDGNELFGTKSGDGFADLRMYDADENGWIDEADEVFSKLKVWCIGSDGNESLMSLKEAGVGAIYLGNSNTEFSLYGATGLNGVVRSTGFFLKEEGGMGAVQQVDLVASQSDQTKASEFNQKREDVTSKETPIQENLQGAFPFYRKTWEMVRKERSEDTKGHSDRIDDMQNERQSRISKSRREWNAQQMKRSKRRKKEEMEQLEKVRAKRMEHAKYYKTLQEKEQQRDRVNAAEYDKQLQKENQEAIENITQEVAS